jgi:hypothetical protein
VDKEEEEEEEGEHDEGADDDGMTGRRWMDGVVEEAVAVAVAASLPCLSRVCHSFGRSAAFNLSLSLPPCRVRPQRRVGPRCAARYLAAVAAAEEGNSRLKLNLSDTRVQLSESTSVPMFWQCSPEPEHGRSGPYGLRCQNRLLMLNIQTDGFQPPSQCHGVFKRQATHGDGPSGCCSAAPQKALIWGDGLHIATPCERVS